MGNPGLEFCLGFESLRAKGVAKGDPEVKNIHWRG